MPPIRNVDPDQIGSGPRVMPAEPKPDTLTFEQQIEALEHYAKALEAGRIEGLAHIGELLQTLAPAVGIAGPSGAALQGALKLIGGALAKRFAGGVKVAPAP